MLPDSVFGSCILKRKQSSQNFHKGSESIVGTTISPYKKYKNNPQRIANSKCPNRIEFEEDDDSCSSKMKPKKPSSKHHTDVSCYSKQKKFTLCKKPETLSMTLYNGTLQETSFVDEQLTPICERATAGVTFPNITNAKIQKTSSIIDLQDQSMGCSISKYENQVKKEHEHLQNYHGSSSQTSEYWRDILPSTNKTPKDPSTFLASACNILSTLNIGNQLPNVNSAIEEKNDGNTSGVNSRSFNRSFISKDDRNSLYDSGISNSNCDTLSSLERQRPMVHLDWRKCQSDLISLTETHQKTSLFLHQVNRQIIKKQQELQDYLSRMLSSQSIVLSGDSAFSSIEHLTMPPHIYKKTKLNSIAHPKAESPQVAIQSFIMSTPTHKGSLESLIPNMVVDRKIDPVSSTLEKCDSDCHSMKKSLSYSNVKPCIGHYRASYVRMMTSGKPRCLVLNNATKDTLLNDTLITCDIHGEFQTFSLRDKKYPYGSFYL